VASCAVQIRTGILPALVDDLLERLTHGDTQSHVKRENVAEMVSSPTRSLTGGTAPKRLFEGRKKKGTNKGRTNHTARNVQCMQDARTCTASGRSVLWSGLPLTSQRTLCWTPLIRGHPSQPLKLAIQGSGVSPAHVKSLCHQVCLGTRGKF
jgi:hypothetical protein